MTLQERLEFVDKWLAELRSGERKQAIGGLHLLNDAGETDGQCCLGVACELAFDAGSALGKYSPAGREAGMSRRVNGVSVIEAEPDLICFQCGKIAETRPYGPNGEEICFECGMKDPKQTERMMGIKLFGASNE